MTIDAAFVLPEAIILGADSATQQMVMTSPDKKLVKCFNHAQKIFEIGRHGNARFGLCTWGGGMLGSFAHRTVAARLADRVGDRTSVREAVEELLAIASEPSASQGRLFVGYFLAGTEPGTREPTCFKIELRTASQDPSVERLDTGTSMFVGAPRFFNRAELGFDPDLPALMKRELRDRLQRSPGDFDKVFDEAFAAARSQLPMSDTFGVPLRDAIDFVHMYLHLTIKAQKFQLGPITCGGSIDISYIASDGNFRWARHKQFDSGLAED